MPNLFPTGYEEEIISDEDVTESGPIGYKNGVAFDYETGDFIRDGKNKLVDSTGIESWKSWVINCLSTKRYAYLAYSSDFGIDTDAAFRATSRDEAESILTREITEAIMADPYQRTQYIEDITYEWTAADAVRATMIIHGIDEVTIDLTAYITKGDM